MVQPSSRREGFSAIPNVKWDDVGGLHLLRQEFNRYIVRHIKFPEDYEVIVSFLDLLSRDEWILPTTICACFSAGYTKFNFF